MMAFVRFTLGDLEWGFDVPDGYVPAVGDTVMLGIAERDTESDDAINATVVKRQWPFLSDWSEWKEIFIEVESDETIPSGWIADSTEWPSTEWSDRKRQFEDDLERMGRLAAMKAAGGE